MSNLKTYAVLRIHEGDKTYLPGDTREADPVTVRHLVDLGVLKEVGGKSEQAPKNKMEPSPKNKSRDYADMTVAELRALAEADGVDLGEAKLKADIVAVFEARKKERPDDPEAGE